MTLECFAHLRCSLRAVQAYDGISRSLDPFHSTALSVKDPFQRVTPLEQYPIHTTTLVSKDPFLGAHVRHNAGTFKLVWKLLATTLDPIEPTAVWAYVPRWTCAAAMRSSESGREPEQLAPTHRHTPILCLSPSASWYIFGTIHKIAPEDEGAVRLWW